MQDLWKRLQYPRFPWTGANSFCSLRSREHASIFFEILNAYSICACSSVYTYIQDSIQYHSHVCTFDIYIIMYHISKVHTCEWYCIESCIIFICIYISSEPKVYKFAVLWWKDCLLSILAYFIKRSSFCQKFVFSWKLQKKNSMFPWFWKGSKKDLKGRPGQLWYSSWHIPIFNAILYPFCVLIFK
jgi:hypothetical protein